VRYPKGQVNLGEDGCETLPRVIFGELVCGVLVLSSWVNTSLRNVALVTLKYPIHEELGLVPISNPPLAIPSHKRTNIS